LHRRAFLRFFSVGTAAAVSAQLFYRETFGNLDVAFEDTDIEARQIYNSIRLMKSKAPDSREFLQAFTSVGAVRESEQEVILSQTETPSRFSYLSKMRNYESPHEKDLYLPKAQYPVLISTFKRLSRVQQLVGHGNFNVLGFDEMQQIGRRYSAVGRFSRQENDFFESLFLANAKDYGFLGEKVTTDLTSLISRKNTKKIGKTGHFLYRGSSEALYKKLKADVGETITLTSGIRSVVKQTHLFIAKTIQSEGNLSKASRSLAPPGHSYHGVGDFDVGKVGYGSKNFTEAFSSTDEFKKLVDLGYVSIRYPRNNMLGVRYEPWHIKVV